MTRTEEIEACIMRLMARKRVGVSHVEIERALKAEGIDPDGDFSISLESLMDRNIYEWFNISQEYADAIGNLLAAGKIVSEPTTYLVYLVDGKVPRTPVAKSLNPYKKPRWIPTCFNLA